MIDIHKLAHFLCERRADRQDDTTVGDPFRIRSPRWADLTPAERQAYVTVAQDMVDFLEEEQKAAMRNIRWEK